MEKPWSHHSELPTPDGAVRAFETKRGSESRSYIVRAFRLPKDLSDNKLGGLYGNQELVDDLVWQTTYMGTLGDGFAEGEVKKALREQDKRFILTLHCDERAVGLAILMHSRGGGWQVRLVMVQDDHGGRGLAQVLIDEMQLQFMGANGGEDMAIDLKHCLSSKGAIQLWVRNGALSPGKGQKQDTKTVEGVDYRKGGLAMSIKSKPHTKIVRPDWTGLAQR